MSGRPDDLAGRVERLEARLDRAESLLALHELKARYGQLVDDRFARGAPVAPDRMAELARRAAELFTEDGVWDGGPGLGVARGRREIAERLAAPTLVFSRHLFVAPHLEVDGDSGRGRWQLLSPCTRPDGTSLWVSGLEEDVYARVDGTWLHRSMTLTTFFVAPAGGGWPRILA